MVQFWVVMFCCVADPLDCIARPFPSPTTIPCILLCPVVHQASMCAMVRSAGIMAENVWLLHEPLCRPLPFVFLFLHHSGLTWTCQSMSIWSVTLSSGSSPGITTSGNPQSFVHTDCFLNPSHLIFGPDPPFSGRPGILWKGSELFLTCPCLTPTGCERWVQAVQNISSVPQTFATL